ncbi:MAG: PAS domain-containing sensor histidine kinase [Bacillota bacterium]|nr:PAS domain-containing sensor histidine kinase [Bacillota bacterium]
MNYNDDNAQKDLLNLLAAIKLFTLLFCLVIVINGRNTSPFLNDIGGLSFLFFPLMFIIVYYLWYIFSVRAQSSRHYKRLVFIENIIFSLIIFSMVFLSDTYGSQYKIVFIFVIILSTLQLGITYGIISSMIISLSILIIDIRLAPSSEVNSYFQNDLVLVGVFIATAWSLGYYVRLESERIKQKDIHLKKLNEELQEQDKHRRAFEEILLKDKNCYNLLLENSGDMVLVHRSDRILLANDRAARLLGFSSSADLKGMSFSKLVSEDSREAVCGILNEYDLKGSDIITFEEKIITASGDNLSVVTTSTGFIYEGEPTILSILHDVTSDKKAEKLQMDVEKNMELLNESLEYNRMITEFFSNISHELRTPLNVIYSAIQVLTLKDSSVNTDMEKQHKYYSIIHQNTFRLMRLINNILDLSKLDSGFLKLNASNHDIISTIENISLSVVPYMESKAITLIFDTDVEEKVMSFDPDKLERIILNLLSNAFKFTNPDGYIFVTIKDTKSNMIISVKDTGIGIPEDKLDFIFERFGQVDKTLKRFHEGTGIGLSLVKSFVELHGGTIEVRSRLNEGSEFIITLPVITAEEDGITAPDPYSSNIELINIEFSDIYS